MKHIIVLIILFFLSLGETRAQYNTNRLIVSGQSALYYEDYVLSIQYFNQVISAKPYLYEPWFYRGLAKFYLDDFSGSEADVSKAIDLNPYIYNMFELRGLCRIKQHRYGDAISDYNHSIRLYPQNKGAWYNRTLCKIENKDYNQAQLDLDTIIGKWKSYASAYTLKAQVYLLQKDTLSADAWLDKGLEVDSFDADAWNTRAMIALSRSEWKRADFSLGKAIHLKPKNVNNYVNRALARYNLNNLRGAMSDYDLAIDFDSNNFLAHYNRGLLRMQLGDDNRAIDDFDYVIRMEPNNVIAIFNRALLLDKTGNLRGAIRDYTKVIDQFPNFWTGLSCRARCYRRLGMTAKAELDEFRIMKAQMNKHLGIQPRWSKAQSKQMRRRGEIDIDKYNQIVVSDDNDAEHEYKSDYRGKVQNRSTGMDAMPMFHLSLVQYANDVRSYRAFSPVVEKYNTDNKSLHLYVNSQTMSLSETQSLHSLALVDSLSKEIDKSHNSKRLVTLLVQRAVAESVTRNFEAAVSDINTILTIDSTSVLALWQKAYCQTMQSALNKAEDETLQANSAIDMLTQALRLDADNQYLYYNRACVYMSQRKYAMAIDDFTRAVNIDSGLAEAFYNRGLSRVYNGSKKEGIADLSKAGELGLYKAYNVIKQVTSDK